MGGITICGVMAKKKLKKLDPARSLTKRLIQGWRWRLVIPALKQFGLHPARDDPRLQALKQIVLERLFEKQRSRGLQKWCVAWQTHPATGYAHLDILLIYGKRITNTLKHYDYLLKHGNLTRYRTVTKAILEYGTKQDPRPLMNFKPDLFLLQQGPQSSSRFYKILRKELYGNPFTFNFDDWLTTNDLWQESAAMGCEKYRRLIAREQQILCRRKLMQKPGIHLITPELIRERLDQRELIMYQNWSGYAKIVEFINEILTYTWDRPFKSRHILLVGRPNIGKTTLFRELQKYVPAYPLGTHGVWFPDYADHVFKFLRWDEFNLSIYSYPLLLKLLEGSHLKLPVKGSHANRFDNQLIVMTSNLTLEQHICQKFKKATHRAHARANLGARICQVVVHKRRKLFFLTKLFKSLAP